MSAIELNEKGELIVEVKTNIGDLEMKLQGLKEFIEQIRREAAEDEREACREIAIRGSSPAEIARAIQDRFA